MQLLSAIVDDNDNNDSNQQATEFVVNPDTQEDGTHAIVIDE